MLGQMCSIPLVWATERYDIPKIYFWTQRTSKVTRLDINFLNSHITFPILYIQGCPKIGGMAMNF